MTCWCFVRGGNGWALSNSGIARKKNVSSKRTPTKFILGLATSFTLILALIITSHAESNFELNRKLDTLYVLPGEVSTETWQNSERALSQDLNDDAVYQSFTKVNSAYLEWSESSPSNDVGNTQNTSPTESEAVTGESEIIAPEVIDGVQSEVSDTSDSSGNVEGEGVIDEEKSEPEPEAIPEATGGGESPLSALSRSFFRFTNIATALLPLAQESISTPITTTDEPVGDAVDTSVSTDVADVPQIQNDGAQDTVALPEAIESPSATDGAQEEGDEVVDMMSDVPLDDGSDVEEVETLSLDENDGSNSITFDDFALPALNSGEFIKNVQLRMSFGSITNVPVGELSPYLDIEYSFGDTWVNAGSILLDGEVSNALNGGSFLFALPRLMHANDFEDFEVRLSYVGDEQHLERAYVDSVWLQIDTETFDRGVLGERILPAELDNLTLPSMYEFVGETLDFSRDELPKFSLKYESQRNRVISFFRSLFGRKLMEVEDVVFIYGGGDAIPVVPQIDTTAEGLVTIQLSEKDKDELRPGTYTVQITVDEGGKEFTDTFTFQWGVLAINPDQTEYELSATSTIMMGVVSENGNTLCSADLRLYIIDPNEYISESYVAPSGECNGNNVTENADYLAEYVPAMVGTYEMYLEHIDANGDVVAHTSDTFEVIAQHGIDLVRDGPTRINPRYTYPMTLTVTSKNSFSGELVEFVPLDFIVSNTDAVITESDGMQKLTWDIDHIGGGSKSYTYTFDAPDISPFLYTLGPAMVTDDADALIVFETVNGFPQALVNESVFEEIGAGVETPLVEEVVVEEIPVEPTVESEAVVAEEDVPIENNIIEVPVVTNTPEEVIEVTPDTEVPSDTLSDIQVIEPEGVTETASSTAVTNNFKEHRKWQIASDATGSALLYWDGTIIPSGWTCVSCAPAGAFYQRFVMGSSTAGVNGGSATHSHTATGAVTASAGSQGVDTNNQATPRVNHTHTYTPTISTDNNLPPYRNLVIIQSNSAGEPASIPAGAIALFDATVPSGWTRYSAQDGTFIQGESTTTIATTGGADTHTHTASGNTGNSASTLNARNPGTSISVAAANHNHSVSTTTGTGTNLPPYLETILGKLNATSTATDAMIAMWTDTPPTGWNTVSSSTEPFENRFVLASTTYGTAGGASTHAHADMTGVVSGAPNATVNRDSTPVNGNVATAGHTHAVSITSFTTVSHVPPYRTAVFAKRSGGSAPSAPTMHALFDSEKTGTSTLTFEFTGNDPDGVDTLTYQFEWDDDGDLSDAPLGSHTSDDESGCSPDCFTNTVTPADTSPFNDNERIQFDPQTTFTSGVTYYWRVRAMETVGAVWGTWSEVHSFTYESGLDPSKWFQTEGSQFETGTLTNIATTSGGVELSVPDPSEALVVYGEGVVQTPRYQIWDGSAWGGENSAQSVGGTIQWMRTEAGTTRDEYILGTQDALSDINVQIYNGTASTWGNLLEVTATVSDTTRRGFDVAYETNSGDALIVYCDGDSDPSSRIWNGTAWTFVGTATTTSANNCNYISLASDPTSDEIILVTRDTGSAYQAFVWDGTSWGNPRAIGSMTDTNHEGIAIEYEESGDQAMVVTSNGNTNGFAWATWSGGSWNSGTQALGDDFEWGVLRRDEGSDNMALCYIDNDADIGIVRWNGLAWQTNQEIETLGNIFDGRAVSCEFEVTTGRDGYLMIPYSDDTAGRYQVWNGTSFGGGEASISTIQDSWEVGSVRAGDGKILSFFHDDTNTQFDFSYWDGSTWSGIQTLETSPSVTVAPFRQPIAMTAQVYQSAQGTIVSDPINFNSVPGQPTWGEVSWNVTEPSGTDVLLQVMYGTSCATSVPDIALAGNSAGFDITQSPLDITGVSTTTYNNLCLRATLSTTNSSIPSLDDWTLSWEREPYLIQADYRWYANSTSTTPTDPWPVGAVDVDEDEAIITASPGLGSVLRLRMSIHDENVALSTSTSAFKLQYASSTDCTVATWSDVGAIGSSSPEWRGYNNAGISDGVTLSSLLLSTTTVLGTYEEANSSALNPNIVGVGNDVEFDWVLEHNGLAGTQYCFRAVTSDGVELNEYTNYPTLTTNASPNQPTLSTLFDNEKTATVTPNFQFSASDPEGEDLSYQIQIDNDYAFDSTVADRNTVDDGTMFENLATPADKDPFNTGETIEFRLSSALTNGVTYYWRVRSKDPNGSGAWGSWSQIRSFTIDTGLTASAWFQTTDEQFDTDSLEDTETSVAESVSLSGGFTTGTTTGTEVRFDWGTSGNAWDSFTFTDVEASSDLKYRIQYYENEVWADIPDTDLPGNSTGFDTSPVNLLGLDTATYNTIRVVAVFTDAGASPVLQEWTIYWGYKILPPDINMLFPNERQATTTPVLEFFTSDPQGDTLVYQVQWSTTYNFTASTTRTSSSSSGFANITTPADTSPFNSGELIQYTIQPGDALTDNVTYWWRVRAVDPLGSNNYSAFTDPQSFTVSSTTNVSTWFQTTSEQFLTDSLSGITTLAQSATVATTAIESLVGYAEGTAPEPRYRLWDGTVWGSELQALSVGSAITWLSTKPGETREEYLLGTLGTDGDVNIQVYQNGSWGNLQEITTGVPNTTARGFDIAYENVSGDAMVVSCDGDADPVYYIWDGAWTLGGTINLNSSNNCTWIRLMSDPVSDEIILMARDSSGLYYELFVWSGSSWGNSTTLGSMNEVVHEGVTGSYEESGAQAVVVASNGINASFVWKAWDGAVWSATTTVALGDDFESGALVSDVGSDNMALCYVDEDNDIGAVRWTGAGFVATVELETAWAAGSTVKNDRPVDCLFEVGGARDGYIMVAYSDTTNVRYRVWDGAVWVAEASVSTIQDSARVQLRRTFANLPQLVAYDMTNDRYDYSSWNGATWSVFQSLETNGVSGAYPYKEPFMIAPRNPGSTGTIVGNPGIAFYDGAGPYWQELNWTDSEPSGSTILYQVEYYDGVSWELVPDSLIPNNSVGTSTGPISLINVLPVSTYNMIRPVANLSCNLGTCPTLSDWTLTWSAGITVSGTAQQYDQSANLTSGTVAVAINGALQVGRTGTISGGTWSIANVNAAPGDVITVFISGVADTNEAVAKARYDGVGDMSGLRLYERHVTIGSNDATSTPFTNTDLGLYDYSNNEDLFFNATGTALSTCVESGCADAELYIMASTTYAPSGSLTLHDIENNGTLIAQGNTLTVSGSWDNNGTTTMGTSTVIFTATSTTETIDGTGSITNAFYNVTFGNGATTATWTPLSTLDIDNNLTVSNGTLSRDGVQITVGGNLTTGASGFWSGSATTTFDGTGTKNWSDSNAILQNVGNVHVDGTSKTIQLTGNVKAQSVTIGADDILDVSTGNFDITVLTDWINNNTFVPRAGEVIFGATTTNRIITAGGDAFYDLTFNGVGGSWSFTEADLSVTNDFRVSTGTVTMPTGTTTLSGTWNSVGGTFAHNNGTLAMTSASAETISASGTPFTNNFYTLAFNGSGSWTFLDTSATTSNDFRIQQGTVMLPQATLSVSGNFTNTGGTFTHNSGTVAFTGTGARVIDTNASFNNVLFSGSGSWSFVDTSVTVLGSLTATNGTVTLPSSTLTLGGSLVNTAVISHNSGTVLFNSSDTGEIINLGNSTLYDATFNSIGGGWTITAPATTTNNFTLSTTSTFTLASGQTLAVLGTFTNNVSNASTTWTGSTLSLEAGNYSINSKTNLGDTYDTLRVKANTDIKMWNSSASLYVVDGTGSLYSQDHAGVDGVLYIFGAYERISGNEYWSYATDFDGTALGGGSRQVDVRFAGGASASFTDATLQILGTAVSTTTVDRQSGGLFGIVLSNSTLNAQYYDIRHQNELGLRLLNGTTITSLANGHFTVDAIGGSAITASSSTIDLNPGLQIYNVQFDTAVGALSDLTTGDGENTFIFFDDFNDGSINTSKWTKDVELGSITETGGYLRAGGGIASGNYGHVSLGSEVGYASFLDNSVVWRARNSTNGIGELVFRGDYGTNRGYKARFDQRVGTNGNAFLETPYSGWTISNGTGTCTSDSLEPVADQWYRYEVTASSTNFIMYRDGASMRNCTDNTFALAGEIALQNHYGSYTDYDWVGVRPFVTPAPTSTSWGVEETVRTGLYRESHVVTGSIIGAQTDYVLPITVNYGAGTDAGSTMYCDSLCNTNFSDVRFTNQDGSPLSYWRDESFATSSTATFWVKFDSIPASPATTSIYAYYGDVSGYNVTQSDGAPTSYWWFRSSLGDIDGESYDNDTGNPGSIRWDDSALTINVSGTVYSDDGVTPMSGPTCNDSTQNIRIVVEGGSSYTGDCASADGTFSIPGVVIVGDPVVTAYLDTNGGAKGTTVTRTPTADITDLDIHQNRVITRHEDTAPLNILNMAVYDFDNDSDIRFTAATGTLTVLSGSELHVASTTTFAPVGDITINANASGTASDGSLHLARNAVLTGYATSTYTIGGSFTMDEGAVFTPASTTVIMNATTTGKTITTTASQEVSFSTLEFNGVGGGWNINGDVRAYENMLVTQGTVSGTADVTVVNGSLTGDGVLSMGGGTTTINSSNTLGGATAWTFANLVLGNASIIGTTTPASNATTTILGKLTISTAHFLNAGGSFWNFAGTGNVFAENGTFVEGTSTVRYSGTGATNILSTTYHNLDLKAQGGSPTYTAVGLGIVVNNNAVIGNGTTVTFDTSDPALDVNGNLSIETGGTFIGSGSASTTIAGDWDNNGTFTGSGGTIVFDGASASNIYAGNSSFSNVRFNGTGTFTVAEYATATVSLMLRNAGSFTLSSGQTLAVGGTFTNEIGGAGTTWTGSTLSLYGGGNYAINASTTSDIYNVLNVRTNTQIRMWNSSASTYDVHTSGSLYSQNHTNVTGDLYIFGAYAKSTGVDYWSYATDFDGTILGSPRNVDVYIAGGGSVLYTGGGLSVVGDASASTTIQNQGSGTYTFRIGGNASTTWSYYQISNTDSSGLVFSGTPTVVTLSHGDFDVTQNSGTALTVGGTVMTQNPARTFTNNSFATSTGVGPAYNVTATGTTVSSWRFTNHTGTIDGEAFDVDPTGDPGYVVWDDSAANITVSGIVYSDEGTTPMGASVCDGGTQSIHLRVGGLTSYTGSCNGSGAYSISGVLYSPGDSLIVYIDGETEKAATVTEDPISSIGNMDLYENRVIVRHEGTDPLSIVDMSLWDSSDDADIPFTAVDGSPDTLTVPANRKLIVWGSKEFEPNGNVTVSGGGGGSAYDGTLELYSSAIFDATGSETHTIGGSLIAGVGASIDDETSTFTFTTTGGARTIDTNEYSFYNAVFNGSGSWTITNTALDVGNDLTITQGAVTLPSGTTTITGTLSVTSGSFNANGGNMLFNSATAETITASTSAFNTLTINGAGSFALQGTHATATSRVRIENGTFTSVSGTFTVGENFINDGTFAHNSGTLRMTSAGTAVLTASSSDLGSVIFSGGGAYSFTDEDVALLGSLTIQSGAVAMASGTMSIGGSFVNSGGTFTHATGTVLFNSSDVGETINSGVSTFNSVSFASASGGWTITNNATTTGNFSLVSATSFAVSSSTRLAVQGVFTNLVGGGATTWTGSTLAINSGVSYTINTKTSGGDTYNTVLISSSTALRAWDSAGSIAVMDANSSFYSQDHAGVSGSLYIFGNYVRRTGADYWSYATDFDGTALGGSSRQAFVYMANGATTTLTGGSLDIVGTAGFDTTINNQGSGTYGVNIMGGTLNAQYYSFTNMGAEGLTLSGTTTITSLTEGNFTLAQNGGSLITLSSTTLNHNAGLVVTGASFATTSAITGYNINLVGTTPSAWTFVSHTGNLSGEAFDNDGGDDCGSLRWSNSTCLLTQQSGYRWRNDDGGEGVPNSEWFDLDWGKRKRVTVTNADAIAYTDAVVKLTVTYDADMQADFDDVRFTSSDGVTPLNHFTETYSASSQATVWVKVPTLATSTDTEVYMYYGNGAVSDGSATSTFAYIDTFEDGGIAEYSGDTSIFAVDGTYAYERTNGLDATGNESAKATDGIYRNDVTVSQGQTIRYMQYISTTAGSGDETCTLFGVQSPGSNNLNYAVCLELFGTDRVSLAKDVDYNDTSGTILASTTITYATGWHEVEIDWATDDSIGVTVSRNGTVVATTSATDASYTQGGVGFTFWFQNGGWDIYSSRTLTATTPTTTFGFEQVPGGATWLAPLNTTATGVDVGDSARIRFLVENTGLTVANQNYEIEFAPKGASPSCEAVNYATYVEVPNIASCGTSDICMVSSSQFTNLASTTDVLGGIGTFTYGQIVEDASNNTGNITLNDDEYTELEYVISPTTNVTDSNYCFRVSNEGTDLDSYAQVAELGLRFAPNITSLVFNDSNDITLLPGTTTRVYATGTVTDLNGYTDLGAATTTFYQNGPENGVGYGCSIDNNNCYRMTTTGGSCSYTNCGGDSCDIACYADVYYHANPTDIFSPDDGDAWTAYLEVTDLGGAVATNTSYSPDLITLRAISMDSSIDYGALAVNSDTGAYNATTTLENIGNGNLDISIEGTDLTDGGSSAIPVTQQHFATSTFSYSSCVYCSSLGTTSINYKIDLAKPASTTPSVTDDIFWGIAIPFGVAGTPHTGTNIFYAIGDI